MVHDLRDQDKILGIAIQIAKNDGVILPSIDNLVLKSFAGIHNFFIIDLNDRIIHQVNIKRIKNYLDKDDRAKELQSKAVLDEHSSELCDTIQDKLKNQESSYNSSGPLYKINSKGFCCDEIFMKLTEEGRAKAIEYLIVLQNEIGEILIDELLDEDDNCLLDIMDSENPEEASKAIAKQSISSFHIKQNEFYFTSREAADKLSDKLKGILSSLNIIQKLDGSDYLHLGAINPEPSEEGYYMIEMEDLLATYYSFLPSMAGLVRG
jgi:hypothetical protein